MAGKITTHVLDTANGCPAAYIELELWIIDEYGYRLYEKTIKTNGDGRCDQPIVADEALQVGVYELVFLVGDYFRRRGVKLPDPAFCDRVPIRFGVADPNAHYHVPLLTSPWSYSTYRGS